DLTEGIINDVVRKVKTVGLVVFYLLFGIVITGLPTYALFPYTTLFRSTRSGACSAAAPRPSSPFGRPASVSSGARGEHPLAATARRRDRRRQPPGQGRRRSACEVHGQEPLPDPSQAPGGRAVARLVHRVPQLRGHRPRRRLRQRRAHPPCGAAYATCLRDGLRHR